jgi:hypothetical protein
MLILACLDVAYLFLIVWNRKSTVIKEQKQNKTKTITRSKSVLVLVVLACNPSIQED